jgi:hypothetical protein
MGRSLGFGLFFAALDQCDDAIGCSIRHDGDEQVLEKAGVTAMHDDKFVGQEDRTDDHDFDDELGTLIHGNEELRIKNEESAAADRRSQ